MAKDNPTLSQIQEELDLLDAKLERHRIDWTAAWSQYFEKRERLLAELKKISEKPARQKSTDGVQ